MRSDIRSNGDDELTQDFHSPTLNRTIGSYSYCVHVPIYMFSYFGHMLQY